MFNISIIHSLYNVSIYGQPDGNTGCGAEIDGAAILAGRLDKPVSRAG
jgi:hypothetical protein